MTALWLLLVLTNLLWAAAYVLKATAKKQKGNVLRIGPITGSARIEIEGYSTRETLAILDTLNKEMKR